jgi:DNA modification methylase
VVTTIHYTDPNATLHVGDALDILTAMPDASVDCIVTSPPYWAKRDCGIGGQYGHEDAPAGYVAYVGDGLVGRQAAGLGTKNLLGLPWRVAVALQEDGWIIRNAVVWHKPNAMPESVRYRLNCQYELIFLLVKSRRYWFDLDSIRTPHTRRSTYRRGFSLAIRG